MIRQVKADLYQIGECVDGEHGHEAVRVYVLLNNGRPIIIDCGSHLHRQTIFRELDTVLAGAIPEYVFLTHSELPHSGNLQKVATKWPQIQVLVSTILLPYIELAPVIPLDQITTVAPGSVLYLAGRSLVFVAALLKDQPGTQWIYDRHTKTLFTGDGFGFYHAPGLCALFSHEVEGGIQQEQFRAYHANAFRFLRWVKPERFNADLDKLFQNRPVDIIAPTHGNAICGDIPAHLKRVKQAISDICAHYQNGA